MHNLTKIRLFRILLAATYPIALIFILPIALLKKKKKSRHFFFFDRYVLGGAQRIHIDILRAVDQISKQVYFTRKSANESFKKEFYQLPNTHCKDIHFWCDNLFFRIFTVHFYAFYLNRHTDAVVFSSNSTFFYDLLPWIKKTAIRKIELLHNFTFGKKGMEFFGLANYRFLDTRIVYDAYTLSNIRKQYAEHQIPSEYLDRIAFIEPGVEIPGQYNKSIELPLQILYAGRGGVQKRIHLLNAIAETCIERKYPVVFHFAGTMTEELSSKVRANSVLHGQVSDQQQMSYIYTQSHLLLMTSAYEGFPMFIKEGMAHGCVPVVTALEGNKMHLTDGENAMLIQAVEDEEKVITLGIERIEVLINNISLLEKISKQAYVYACEHFTKARFDEAYRKLLNL